MRVLRLVEDLERIKRTCEETGEAINCLLALVDHLEKKQIDFDRLNRTLKESELLKPAR